MTIYYHSSMEGYMDTSMGYTPASDLMCPNCGKRDFRVWFSNVKRAELTCVNCGNFIHIQSVTED